jgi:hypothetical protein
MHQMMMSMHGGGAGQPAQPGMQGMGAGMGMQAQQGAAAGACSMGAGLGALFGACPSNLALTEGQTTQLNAIFERARSEALATLTPEQHEQLHATQGQTAPMAPMAPMGGMGGRGAPPVGSPQPH